MTDLTLAAEPGLQPNLIVHDGQVRTTSLAIAQHFGKRHDDVLKKIRNLDCSAEFHARNFAEMSYLAEIGNGAVRSNRMFEITRDGFVFLVMGFTGPKAAAMKEAYIAAFNAMEARLRSQDAQRAVGLDPALVSILTQLVEGQQALALRTAAQQDTLAGLVGEMIRLQTRTLEVLENLAAKPQRNRRTSMADDIAPVETLHGQGMSYREIAALTGLSETAVFCIVKGKYEVRPDGRLKLLPNPVIPQEGGAA